MDKQLAFLVIGFFVICTSFITWAAIGSPKRNSMDKALAYGWVTFMWTCIAILIICTILYK